MISKLKLYNHINRFCWIIFYYCIILKCFILLSSIQLPNVCATSLTENQRFQTDNINTIDTSHHFTVNHQKEKTNTFRINKYRNNNYEWGIIQHQNGDVSYEPKTIDKQNIYKKNYLDINNRILLNKDEKETPNISLRKHLNSINRKISYANKSKRIKRTVTNDKSYDDSIEDEDDDDDRIGIEKMEEENENEDDESDIELSFDDIKDPEFYIRNNVNTMDELTFDINENNDENNNNNDLIITNEFDDKESSFNKNENTKKFNLEENGNHNQTSDNADTETNFIKSVFGDTINEQEDNGIREREKRHTDMSHSRNVDEFVIDEPLALPLRPIIRGPFDEEEQNRDEVQVVYVEPHSPIRLNCEVDLDISNSVWMKDGQIVQAKDKSARTDNYRFIKETRGSLTITNVMLEDDGYWQCEAENFRGYIENGRPIKLVVLSPPKSPYLLIDTRRLDASNLFIPVKESSEISLACVSEGGNPKPLLTWEILLSPGVDRHSQKSPNSLDIQEIKKEKEKEKDYKINSGAKSEAKLQVVSREHHNARILCVMEHPSLKIRQNASILLDVQYAPSFAISRVPGFGYPLREGIPVSLKCDVDSNPPSTAMWQKDDQDPPVQQTGDGYLNFTSIRREHSGWYKCTAKHLNIQYSSIGYYLSVRYDAMDVTSEPDEQDLSMSSSSSLTQTKSQMQSHNPFKIGQMEVELGGSVTLHCPQGSLGCWSHLDPVTYNLKGVGNGPYSPTGQYNLKDVVYQEAGIYKCIGQSAPNKKKLEVLNTIAVNVKGLPTVEARNATPIAFPGSPLHLSVEFCANPPAHAARWLHGDRIYTPGKQYGADVLAYRVIDLPTPFCKEARLTYVHMHEKVPRTFYFVVSSPSGVAEAVFHVNFTNKHKNKRINNSSMKNNNLPNSIDDDEFMEPEEIQFSIFGSSASFNRVNHLLVTITSIIIFNIIIIKY